MRACTKFENPPEDISPSSCPMPSDPKNEVSDDASDPNQSDIAVFASGTMSQSMPSQLNSEPGGTAGTSSSNKGLDMSAS